MRHLQIVKSMWVSEASYNVVVMLLLIEDTHIDFKSGDIF